MKSSYKSEGTLSAIRKHTKVRTLLVNNLRTFLIHTVVVLICVLLAIVMTSVAGFLPIFLWVIGLLAVMCLYVFFAYRYLVLLPKCNLLSVSCLTILLVILAIIIRPDFLMINVGGDSAFGYLWSMDLLLALNVPSVYVVGLVYGLLNISDLGRSSTFIVIDVIAAFVPSLLMYIGLCLKMRYQDN